MLIHAACKLQPGEGAVASRTIVCLITIRWTILPILACENELGFGSFIENVHGNYLLSGIGWSNSMGYPALCDWPHQLWWPRDRRQRQDTLCVQRSLATLCVHHFDTPRHGSCFGCSLLWVPNGTESSAVAWRKCLLAILEKYVTPKILEPDYKFSDSGTYRHCTAQEIPTPQELRVPLDDLATNQVSAMCPCGSSMISHKASKSSW